MRKIVKEIYIADDGSEFSVEREAINYEIELELAKLARGSGDRKSVLYGGEVIKALVNNSDKAIAILSRVVK